MCQSQSRTAAHLLCKGQGLVQTLADDLQYPTLTRKVMAFFFIMCTPLEPAASSTAANSAGDIAGDLGGCRRLGAVAYLQALIHSHVAIVDELIGLEAAHGHLLHAGH
jgi:hypothetical protein